MTALSPNSFWDRVAVAPSDAGFEVCWPWVGPGIPSATGHVRVSYQSRKQYVHRLAWLFAVGDPGPSLVRHWVCSNPRCTRPSHLSAFGGALANARDRDALDRRTSRLPRGRAAGQPGAHWSAKLDSSAVTGIRARRAAGASVRELAADHGVSRSTVRSLLAGRTYTDCDDPAAPTTVTPR